MPIQYFDVEKGVVQLEGENAEDRRIYSPTLLALHRYWNSKREGDALPARPDIHPTEIPKLLSAIFIIDVSPEPPSYRFRLIGTGIVELTGRDLTGQPADESTYGRNADFVTGLFSKTVERRRPLLARGSAKWMSASEWKFLEVLMLPLAGSEGSVDMILGGINLDLKARRREANNRLLSVSEVEVILEPSLAS